MSLELDHIFCFCSPALPEAKILETAGFTLTNGRKHQGQGTANRSVVFQSNYLELIYLDSEAEALTNPLQLHLRAKWKTTQRSPFGIALRGEIPAQDRSQFWEYRPPYNPSNVIMMHKFSEQHPEFPLLFVMPSSPGAANIGVRFKDFSSHKTGATNITKVTIQSPFPNWPLQAEIKGLTLEKNSQHSMEVQVDGALSEDLKLNELLRLSVS